MKKFFLFCIILNSMSIKSQYFSNGTGGGDWHTASSWSPNGIPGSSDNVTIQSGDVITKATNNYASCKNLLVEFGAEIDLSNSAYELRVSSSLSFTNNGTIKNGWV